jgi:hypothetical protein
LNNSLALVGLFVLEYSDIWYLTPYREVGNHCGMHSLHLHGSIYLQVGH